MSPLTFAQLDGKGVICSAGAAELTFIPFYLFSEDSVTVVKALDNPEKKK